MTWRWNQTGWLTISETRDKIITSQSQTNGD